MNLIGTLDLQFETALFAIRSPFSISAFKTITLLGETSVIIALSLTIAIVLWRSSRTRAYALSLVAAVLGAGATVYTLKALIERARPNGLLPAITETSSSFPSGHATLSMVLYGFIAYILLSLFPTKKPLIMIAAVLLIGTIGFSRLYLGVHFPSDVLSGYLFGSAWLWLGIRMSGILSKTRSV